MRYRIIDMPVAAELARRLLKGETVNFAEHEQEVGKGNAMPDVTLKKLADEIRKRKKAVEKKKADAEALDSEIFDLIHRGLPHDYDMLGDMRFWARLALVFLFDVVKWRFPGKGEGGFKLENLGLASGRQKQQENYLYKMWVRGELSYDKSNQKDPYEVGRAGGVDFWTSHVHRQGFSSCRTLAFELIRFQYPPALKGKARLYSGPEDLSKGKVGVRTLAKRIRRLWATVEYTILESSELQKLINEMSQGLTVANVKSVSTASGN